MTALRTLRSLWLLVAATAAGAAVGAGWSLASPTEYSATATFVVAPVAPSDPTFLGIDVLHDTGKRTAAQTAARLVTAPEIAESVRVRLGLRESRSALLRHVSGHAARTSSAVAVTVRNGSAVRAAQIANAFVEAFVAARTAGFESEVVSAVRRLRASVAALPPARRRAPEGIRLQQRLADLRALVGTADPTIQHGSEAVAPSSASSPDPVAWTLWGALIGLGAGALLLLARWTLAVAPVGRAVAGGDYDPRVSERIVARLEERLGRRVDALAEERERLARREAGLEAREREIAAKLAELRAAPPPAAPAGDDRPAELDRREHELERREADSARAREDQDEQAAGLRQQAAQLEERAARLEARERALEGAERELADRRQQLDARAGALAEREQALAARVEDGEHRLDGAEQELAERTEQLDARDRALAERERALAEREQALAARLQEGQDMLAGAERELAARKGQLDARDRALAERERRQTEQAGAAADEREELLARRVRALEDRERALIRRGAELRLLENRLAQEAQAPAPEPAAAPALAAPVAPEPPAPPPVPAAPPAPPPVAVTPNGSRWTLQQLHRLVDENRASYPDRIGEWESYLFFLRDYATADGRVPGEFEGLIEEAFAEIL